MSTEEGKYAGTGKMAATPSPTQHQDAKRKTNQDNGRRVWRASLLTLVIGLLLGAAASVVILVPGLETPSDGDLSRWIEWVMGGAGVIALAGFMPLSALSFFYNRLPKKKQQFERMLEALGYPIGENQEPREPSSGRPAYVPTLEQEYTLSDYFPPVLFAFVISLLGAMTLILAGPLVGEYGISIVLSGPGILTHPRLVNEPEKASMLFGMLVIGLAFAGSYIWSVQTLFRRLATLDLPPGAYYSVGVRMVLSIFVALVIYYLMLPEGGWSAAETVGDPEGDQSLGLPKSVAVTAFLVGMFPQRALQYLQEKFRFSSANHLEVSEQLPLEMIEGIEIFERLRLAEVGIDNSQNLATANFIELVVRTPFNPREIIDWIGQARLYLFCKADIVKLREAGVRTIFDLLVLGDKEKLEQVSAQTGLAADRLAIIYEILKEDYDVKRLKISINTLLGELSPESRDGPASNT